MNKCCKQICVKPFLKIITLLNTSKISINLSNFFNHLVVTNSLNYTMFVFSALSEQPLLDFAALFSQEQFHQPKIYKWHRIFSLLQQRCYKDQDKISNKYYRHHWLWNLRELLTPILLFRNCFQTVQTTIKDKNFSVINHPTTVKLNNFKIIHELLQKKTRNKLPSIFYNTFCAILANSHLQQTCVKTNKVKQQRAD